MSALTREIFLQQVEVELRKVLEYIADKVKESFIEQGHHLTGKLEESMRIEIISLHSKVIGQLWVNDYYKYVDQGVSADRIPYSGPGGGGTSKYIQALVEYAKMRMNISDDKEALSVAFAIANTHKKEGMPTDGSKTFSSTGQRTGFFTNILKENEAQIDSGFGHIFESAIESVIAIYNSRVSGNVKIYL